MSFGRRKINALSLGNALKATPRPTTARARESRRRRGRPTQLQVDEINQAILETAQSLFVSHGFETTSMEAVAAKAGVSKSTLYARYPTKQLLFRAVVEDRVASWSAMSASRDHLLGSDLRQRLQHHADTIISSLMLNEIRAFERVIAGASTKFPELARAMHEIGYRFTLRMLLDEIERGTANDKIPARKPERVAEMLFAMLSGWYRAEEAVREIPAAEAQRFARDAIDLLFHGRAAW